MRCRTLHVRDLDAIECLYLHRHLTRDGSDFANKLASWASGVRPARSDGTIALVEDQGEIIGWARTEIWWEEPGHMAWDTLESFVTPEWRGRGIASWAAAGLACGELCAVAVFRPSMLLLAKRVGLHPVLFQKDEGGRWVRA